MASTRKQSTSTLYAPPPLGNPVERLLACLDGVRPCGDRWRADCPIGHRSRGTLSIAMNGEGAVLMKCFAGCGATEVIGAVGLTLADLFPVRPEEVRTPRSPAERREIRERTKMVAIKRTVPELAFEARVVLAAAGMLSRGERLKITDEDRLVQAIARIESARAVLYGR